MEVGSSGGPEKNRVYGLSNTTAENLRSARGVSTVGSSPSVSSTQSEEFVALKNNMNDSRRIIISSVKWSWRLDQGWVMIHACAAPFWSYGPGNNRPPPAPPPPAPPLF